MSDFRCHYLGSYDPQPDPQHWSDEYLAWFYWATRGDDTLPIFYTPERIAEFWASEWWSRLCQELDRRGMATHVAQVWS